MRLTFFNLFDVILEAVEATTKLVILEIQLGPPYNVNLGDRLQQFTYHGETGEHLFCEDRYP